jgi:hypothetical protein
VMRQPLPGANDYAALITDIVADRGDLAGGNLDHVGPQVVTGNRSRIYVVRHQ